MSGLWWEQGIPPPDGGQLLDMSHGPRLIHQRQQLQQSILRFHFWVCAVGHFQHDLDEFAETDLDFGFV